MAVCDPRGWEFRILPCGAVEVRLLVVGLGVVSRSLAPIDAAMMSVELAEASAAAGAGRKVYATREQRIATIELARQIREAGPDDFLGVVMRMGDLRGDNGAGPIGLPPLPPSGPSSTEVVEARPDEVEAEKKPNATPTNRRRKR